LPKSDDIDNVSLSNDSSLKAKDRPAVRDAASKDDAEKSYADQLRLGLWFKLFIN